MGRQGELFDKAMRRQGDSQSLGEMMDAQLRLTDLMARMGKGMMFDDKSVRDLAFSREWAAGEVRRQADVVAVNSWLSSLKGQATAIIMEGAEVMDWLPWKHWKMEWGLTPEECRAEVAVEAVDLLHFVFNVFLLCGLSPAQVASLFYEKNEENRRRAAEGY